MVLVIHKIRNNAKELACSKFLGCLCNFFFSLDSRIEFRVTGQKYGAEEEEGKYLGSTNKANGRACECDGRCFFFFLLIPFACCALRNINRNA